MLNFEGFRHLKSWLQDSPKGRAFMEEQFQRKESRAAVRLLAIQHADRVDLYSSHPSCLRAETQVHSTGFVEAAESLMEKELSRPYRDIFYPGKPTQDHGGFVGSVSNRKLTIGQYEWNRAYQDAILDLEDIGRRIKEESNAPETSHSYACA